MLELVSPSFYPPQMPSQPSEVTFAEWAAAPANVYMLAYGNLSGDAANLAAAGYLSDVHNPQAPIALQKIYRGPATDAGARKLAHQFADDIVALLSGGSPGIAQTQIAYVSTRSGNKEIWAMDYDGQNQHQLTHLKSISLTPRWAPSADRIAFTCYVPFRGITSPQICLYSTISDRLISFPRYRGSNSSPAWSPDGNQIAFMSSQNGDPEIYLTDASGGGLKRITFAAGVSTSPAWNPKTGKQIVFVSDRGGEPVLYLANSDGTDVQKLDMPDMGYVVDPSWSPNGQLLAFSWRRPSGNFDIYIMDIVTRQLVELTRDQGRNERPSWAPDGRHIVFESTRTGTRHIWSMLADGSLPRQLTYRRPERIAQLVAEINVSCARAAMCVAARIGPVLRRNRFLFSAQVAPKKSNSTKYPGSFRKETRKSQKEAIYAGGYDSEIHALVGSGYSLCIHRRL